MDVAGIFLLITLLVLLVLSSASLGLGSASYKKSQIPILNKDGDASKVTNLNAVSFAAGTLLEERIPTTSLLGTVRPFTTQKGTPEITLVASGGNVDWDTTASQSAFIDLTVNATMRLPQNMINGFTYVLNVEIAAPGPVLTFSDSSYRFGNFGSHVTTTSIVEMVVSNSLVSVLISPLASNIAALQPSHWYNTRLRNAYTVDSKQNVLTWKDFGTSDNTLTKSGGGTLPLVQNALNQIAGISFTNGGPKLQASVSFYSICNNNAMTFFIACKTLTNVSQYPWVAYSGDSSSVLVQVGDDSGVENKFQTYFTSNIGDISPGTYRFYGIVPTLVNNVQILTSRGAASPNVWANANPLSTTISNTVPLTNNFAVPFVVGDGTAGASNPFTGYISELIIFNRVLTDDEVDAVFDELLPIYDLPDV